MSLVLGRRIFSTGGHRHEKGGKGKCSGYHKPIVSLKGKQEIVRVLSRQRRESNHRPRYGKRRSEEHTSELQSLMRISYAVFGLKKTHKQVKHQLPNKTKQHNHRISHTHKKMKVLLR